MHAVRCRPTTLSSAVPLHNFIIQHNVQEEQIASILQLIRSKCVPALLYGLEACPLRSSDNNSLDFVVNRFFMKLFKTNNIETVTYCRMQFNFDLPSTILKKRSDVFAIKYRSCSFAFCTVVINVA